MELASGVCCVLWTMVVAAAAMADDGVSVQRLRLPLDQELTLLVNSSVEYIVELYPPPSQAAWPLKLRTELMTGDDDAGVVMTARRGAAADTWGLGGAGDDAAVERTLCPADGVIACEGGESRWAVHVSAACAATAAVRLRASAYLWDLVREHNTAVAALGAPALLRYSWVDADGKGVRLLLDAEDNVCTTVAVLNYTCPVPQSVSALPPRAMRLTMLRSAALYVQRSAYPRGFILALLVRDSGEPCGLKEPPASDWLWSAAVDSTEAPSHSSTVKQKAVTVTVQQAAPPARYAVASVVTLVLLAIFYLAAGGLALAERRKRAQAASDNGDPQPISVESSEDAIRSETSPEGLTQPSLAMLCRQSPKALASRSRRYLHSLAVVAVFYALPVVQLVAAFQLVLNVSGELDLCYYNGRCALPAPPLADLNHVLSNAGYVLLGGLFVLQVRWRGEQDPEGGLGVPAQRGLLAALGVGLGALGLLSASYHVCPNRLNFQFDAAFMYVLVVLMLVWLYGARHPDSSAPAHSAFGALAALMAGVVAGVLGGGAPFWAVWSAAHVTAVLALSLRVYYGARFRPVEWPRVVLAEPRKLRNGAAVTVLLVVNAANWGLAVYGLVKQPGDFASHLLTVLLANALLHLLWYLANKLRRGERPTPTAWALLGAAAAVWPAALYFFLWGASDWSASPAVSRHLNHECLLLGFYDSHDLWHLLSALALYLTFSSLLVLDDDLARVPRELIAVF